MTDQPGERPDDAPEASSDDATPDIALDGVDADADIDADAGDGEHGGAGGAFRLGYVPGATPGRWSRTWRDRLPDVRLELVQVDAADAAAALADRRVDAAVLRLPVDKDELHAIPLYEELPVVVVSRDHLLAATTEEETVTADDLADDVVWLARDDVLFADGGPVPGQAPTAADPDAADDLRPATAADAIALVATGVGATVVPMSLARLHHRKDVTYRVLEGGPQAPVGLAWRADGLSEAELELVEEMIGIVRGRTVNSSRGRAGRDRAEPSEPARGAADGRREAGRRDGGRGGGQPSGRRPRTGGKPGRGRPRGGRGRR
ncbi:LysR substrate-binding domain-containing protein [Isoptericola sp. 4D.3]|uniref:LysR substrate-binding domain-containing protein n=1 Tax=Isoptericola peretonis TaxID=2918523 RepID=A0ABT0J614_9MICO|nr:LysR substrate-binding domain-containing protein [Isoptericola sp. 4D.3]